MLAEIIHFYTQKSTIISYFIFKLKLSHSHFYISCPSLNNFCFLCVRPSCLWKAVLRGMRITTQWKMPRLPYHQKGTCNVTFICTVSWILQLSSLPELNCRERIKMHLPKPFSLNVPVGASGECYPLCNITIQGTLWHLQAHPGLTSLSLSVVWKE